MIKKTIMYVADNLSTLLTVLQSFTSQALKSTVSRMWPTPGSSDDFMRNVQDTVHFSPDSFVLTTETKQLLDAQAEWAKQWTSVHFLIEGHCDRNGTVEYNLALGEKRAMSVKHYLMSAGVNASRVETVSYGKERPLDSSNNFEADAKNRRAVTIVR